MATILPLFLIPPSPAQGVPSGSATPRAAPDEVHLFVALTQAGSDVTAAAQSPGSGDVWLSKPSGDAMFIGRAAPFAGLLIDVSTSGQGGQLQWQFFKGTGWEPLVARDLTDQLRQTGKRSVVWDLPAEWTSAPVPNVSTNVLYWVRAMNLQPFASAPVIAQIELDVWVGPTDVRYRTHSAWSSEVAVTTLELRDVAARAGVHVAVGASGLVFRSTDGGESWKRVPAPIDRMLKAVEFLTDTTILAVGVGGAVVRSEDKGLTWAQVSGVSTKDLNDLAVVDDQKIVIAGEEVIIRSEDSGVHWTVTSRPGDHLLSVSFPTGLRGFVGGDAGVDEVLLTTDDGGLAWEAVVINPALYSSITDIDAVDFHTATYGWIGGNGYLARTLDAGHSWMTFAATAPLRRIQLTGPTEGWAVGDSGFIARIANGDQPTPTLVDQKQDGTFFFTGLYSPDGRNAVVVGWNGQVLRTTNSGTSWTQPAYRSTSNLNAVDALPDGTIWAAGAGGNVIRSLDGGYSWTKIPVGVTGEFQGIEFVSASTGWVTGATVLRRTTDGGTTWTTQTMSVPTSLFDVEFLDPQTGWVAGSLGKLFKTTDGGITWTEKPTGVTNTLRRIDFVDRNVGYIVGVDGLILKSTDGSERWVAQASGTTRSLLGAYFTDASRGYVVGDYGRILTTVDGGATWTTRNAGTTQILYDVRAHDALNAWVAGDTGTVLVTTDGGLSWISHPPGGDTDYLALAFRPSGAPVLVGRSGGVVRAEEAWASKVAVIDAVRGATVALPLIVTPDEALYIGQAGRFDSVAFRTVDANADAQVIWEYWQGQEWVALGTRDGSGLLSSEGWHDLAFPLPLDWEITVLEGSPPAYFVRARLLSVPSDGRLAVDGILTARLPTGIDPTTPTTTTTTASTSTSTSGGQTTGSSGGGGSSDPAPTTGPKGSTAPATSQLPGLRVKVNPSVVDLGHVRRGSTAQAEFSLQALEGQAALRLTAIGIDDAAFTFVPDHVNLQGSTPAVVKVTAAPAMDAAAGPREVHVALTVASAAADAAPILTVPIQMTVDAAELRKIGFHPSPPAWTAEFANFLDREVPVRVDATIEAFDGAFVRTDRFERVFAAGATHQILEDLEVSEVPAGPYRVRLNGTYGPDRVAQELVVWLGGAPAEVTRVSVSDVRLGHAQITVEVTNRLEYAMTVYPRVDIVTAEGDPITTLHGLGVPLGPHESQSQDFQWDAVFGHYLARATAEVENAETAPAAEAAIDLEAGASKMKTPGPGLAWFLAAILGLAFLLARRPN